MVTSLPTFSILIRNFLVSSRSCVLLSDFFISLFLGLWLSPGNFLDPFFLTEPELDALLAELLLSDLSL
jgi:hypothetical protein